jgi:hypothetical protein
VIIISKEKETLETKNWSAFALSRRGLEDKKKRRKREGDRRSLCYSRGDRPRSRRDRG